eukprot:2154529-Rhodomonas_salina.1
MHICAAQCHPQLLDFVLQGWSCWVCRFASFLRARRFNSDLKIWGRPLRGDNAGFLFRRVKLQNGAV